MENFQRDIAYIIDAHQNHPTKPSKAYRKWDGKTPHYTHPLWCAMTIAAETGLDSHLRQEGIVALLYHDVQEDTTVPLPEWITPAVKERVQEMTFDCFDDERERLWVRSQQTRLYKLYDKVSNLLDGSWMSPEKRKTYEQHTKRLCDDVQQHYGRLTIVKIAGSVLGDVHAV